MVLIWCIIVSVVFTRSCGLRRGKKNTFKKCNHQRNKNVKHCEFGFPGRSVGEEKKLQNKKRSVCFFYRGRRAADVIVQRTVHPGRRRPDGNSIPRNQIIIIIITIMEQRNNIIIVIVLVIGNNNVAARLGRRSSWPLTIIIWHYQPLVSMANTIPALD